MKQLIIFATGNKGKIREIRDIITDPDTEVLSMKEAGVANGKLKIFNKIHIVPVRILNRFYHEALHPFALE